MLLRRNEIRDKQVRGLGLYEAVEVETGRWQDVPPWANPKYHCDTPYLSESGETYRLVEKPLHARSSRLERAGHEIHEDRGPNGGYLVRVPLGVHGADHLGIDPDTGEVACVLCQGTQAAKEGE